MNKNFNFEKKIDKKVLSVYDFARLNKFKLIHVKTGRAFKKRRNSCSITLGRTFSPLPETIQTSSTMRNRLCKEQKKISQKTPLTLSSLCAYLYALYGHYHFPCNLDVHGSCVHINMHYTKVYISSQSTGPVCI